VIIMIAVDYRTGQFTLIPKTPEAERARALGRTGHLARDREGRLSLQLDRGISR
jgi:hypothetical protein